MLVKWAVILSAFIAASRGSISQEKRSDFSMSDNQFYRVGDTELDDEITDCALVEHQFRKGLIRLREYLERKRGCGRQGKLQNIEGIEKSTEDDINKDNIAEIAKSATEDFHFKIPSPIPVVKKAPKTIPQVINTYQPNKMAYVPRQYPVPASVAAHVIPAKQPVLQTTVQRNKPARPSLNDYERESQNLALSFKSNPYVAAAMPSSIESQNTQPQFATVLNDQYTRLASSYNQPNPRKPEHDLLQTFYPNTLQARSREPDTVSVGQPLYIQKARMPPATRAKMQNKVSNLLKNAMNNFNKAPMRNPASTNTFNGATPQLYNKPVANLNVKSNPNENIDDAHADMRDPNESIDDKPPQEPGIDDRPALAQGANSPSAMTLVQKPGEELRPGKPVSNTLNGLGKPVVTGKPTFVSQPPQNTLAQNLAAPAADKVKLGQPSINLDLIKNKILHSTNAAFLRRMLKLIQKITHHKDFHKLQAPARSFVAQANTAVQALNKAYNERVSSSPVTLGTSNKFYPQSKKSAVQTMNQAYNAKIQASPVNLGTGNQLYGNNYPLRKKSTVQALNQAYNKRISASPVNPATGNSQYYRNAYSLSKKFQIARNPYYQNYYQYRQPYYNNLQSIQYGLYNGNVP